MAIGPSYADFERDYWAPDREQVLQGMQNPQQQQLGQAMQAPGKQVGPEVAQQQGAPSPAWDRTAFRDAWMGSGIQNVPDMQNWLRSSGWGQHVGLGGSKGDVMQLPSGENIDAVLAAGLGGNRGGPQWTGRGSWAGGYTPYNQMSQGQQQQPQYGGMQQGGMQPQGWGQMSGGMQGGPMGPSNMYPQMQKMMQNQQHQQFQRGQQQRQQPNYRMNMQRQGMGMMGQQQAQKLSSPGMRAGGIGPSQQRQPMYY